MDFYLMTNKSDIFSHFDAISLRHFFLVFFFFFNLKAFCNSIMNRHQKFNTLNSVQFLFNVFLMMCYVLTYSSFDFHFLLLLSGWADFKEFIGKKEEADAPPCPGGPALSSCCCIYHRTCRLLGNI